MRASVIACVLSMIFSVGISFANTAVPRVESWELLRSDEWPVWLEGDPPTRFVVGTNSHYRKSETDTYGFAMAFRGDPEIVLRAWWSGSKDLKDAQIVYIAAKSQGGEWITTEGGKGVRFDIAYTGGKITAIGLVVTRKGGELSTVRIIRFDPALEPEKTD